VLYPLSYEGGATNHAISADRYPPRVAAPLARVLVVDDDAVIRQLICVNLEMEGFEVDVAVDGQDALEKVRSLQPDLVTLDIMMPRLDGWQAATALREDPDTAGVKVVLLSARAQAADLRRGSRMGVDAYLTKPFDPDELIRTIRRLVGLPD
jgi:CheY-like chemotaxis protein